MPDPFESAIRAAFSRQEEEAEPVYPTREAQLETLRTFVALPAQPWFQRGDLVGFHGPEGPIKKHIRTQLVYVFWRYLDMNDDIDRDRVREIDDAWRTSLPDIDCLIAQYAGDSLLFMPWYSRFLRRLSEAQALIGNM